MTDQAGAKLIGLWGGRVWRFDDLPSTNTWAMEHAEKLQHGDVIWAHAQTAGRGRLGRTWIAAPGRCLTFSLVVAAPEFLSLAPNLGQLAAWAVGETLRGMGVPHVCLKWPNDVMVNDRKAAGLLVESSASSQLYVLGLGLNVNMTAAELEAARLDRPATSMREALDREFDLGIVFKQLLSSLAARFDQVAREGTGPLWDAWRQNDWLRGQFIRVTVAAGQIDGEYRGVDDEGRLIILSADGIEQALWSGDVERVRAAT